MMGGVEVVGCGALGSGGEGAAACWICAGFEGVGVGGAAAASHMLLFGGSVVGGAVIVGVGVAAPTLCLLVNLLLRI